MKAIVCAKYGSPDVLELKEIVKPTPKDNEVLIEIHATTVNRTDSAILRAIPFFSRITTGLFKPKNPILGTEFAGQIEAIGKDVSSFNISEKVFGFTEYSFGTHAQYMTISQDKAIVTIPDEMTYEEAAACSEGSFYAYNFINKVDLKKGQKVLVNGATGGIGSAAVQLSKYFGADVTGVCRSEHFELVRSLGASKVIDYTKEDFTKHDEKYDFVFDTVGKSSFFKCRPVLKPRGIYISSELGYMYQNIFLPLITPLFRKKKTKFPLPQDCKGTLLLIKKIIEEGKYRAVIDRNYPLEKVVEAYRYVEKGQKIGNVVITVEHEDNS
jgi:NADPH:quinone reductase-like Zn-dependent oxidoreductase